MDTTAKLVIFLFLVCIVAVVFAMWRRSPKDEPPAPDDEFGAQADGPPPFNEEGRSGGGGGPKPVR